MMDWLNIGRSNAEGENGKAIVVNVPTRANLLADVETHLNAHTGFAIATINLDHVVKIQNAPDFRAAYQRHSHVTADGNPIVWLSRLSGQQVELIPGSELIDPICAVAARVGAPVGFLGSTEDTLAAATEVLETRHPGLKVVARIAPPMGFDPVGAPADAAIAELQAAGVQLCLLALGAPKQELFAIHAAAQMPQAGFLSIGAGLDFISGRQKRAPRWVRMIAAEWLWRMLLSPARLARRYGACIAILPQLTRAALRARRGVET